ncbi:MAG: formylmethanofuran dehydrogenase subunit B [Anaerolineales bacterium]|nr:formylmethanofuran dehydrogenase subunit B [Anaerolineales bacterium]
MTARRFEDVVCPFCGCLCDDLAVTVEAGQARQVENACWLAKEGYARFPRRGQPAALMDGQATNLETAVDAAAALLRAARSPLVYGLNGVSTEAQRAAVAAADLLRAHLDTAAGEVHGATAYALASGYAQTATLGEVRNLADLVVYWGIDPLETHPRHAARYTAPDDRRQGRTLVVIDGARTGVAATADVFVASAPERAFEVVGALRGLLRGLPNGQELAEAAGLPLTALSDLAGRLKGCRYGVIYYGPQLGAGRAGPQTVAALTNLVTELNTHARVFAQGMGGHANAAGADNVLAWQSGYPQGASYNRGYPRANAVEFRASELLTRGEVDAVLVVAAEATQGLTPEAAARLKRLPVVVIGPNAAEAAWAKVAIGTAVPGVEAGGTLYRMDEVALTASAILPAPYPTAEAVLGELLARWRGGRGG